jgi:hypothetical protein
VKIIEREGCFDIDLNPHSGEGHDFNFSIVKKTGRVDQFSMSVGELISEPDEDDP